MMIKLTNMSNPGVLDMPVYINTNHIASVSEQKSDQGGIITVVYCVNGAFWVVEETISEVIRMINESH